MGGARPAITANFASTQVDLAAFMAPQDGKAKSAAPPSGPGAGGGGAARGGRVFSDDPLPFDLINASDGEMHYQAGKILAQGTTVGDLKMNAVWRNGEFTLKPLTGGLTGGTFAVELGANARAHSMAGKIDVKGVELGTLLQQTGTSDLLRRGKTNFTLDFRGEGRSLRALMASLDGISTVHVGEGAVESRFLDLLGADVMRVLSPLQDGGPQTSLNCVVNRFEIKDGVATPKVMFVDTGKMTISGDGTINLGTEQLALLLTPRPKQASLVSLGIPIRIGGTLAVPSFSPDTSAALRGAAGAAAGSVLLGPAGVIVPFLSSGQGGASADLCSQALAQAGLRGTSPAPSGQQQRAPSQTQQQQQPTNPVDGISRGLRGLFGQ